MPAKRVSNNSVSRRVFGHRQKTAIRVGLYARVSTHDQQTLSLQRRAMHDYVERRGWTIAIEVKEVGSGASVRELRQKLIEAARRRDIDVVIVWRLDRWGRSMADFVTTLQELRDLDVGFVSLTEALDLTTPSGRRNDFRNFVGITLRRMFFVLLRKAARILTSVPRPPACFFHAETLL